VDCGAQGFLDSTSGVGREVNGDAHAWRHAAGHFNVEHDDGVGAVRGGWAVVSVIDGDAFDRGRLLTEAMEVLANVSGTIAAAKLDEADGLAGAGCILGEAIEFGDLRRRVGDGGGARSKGTTDAAITDVRAGDGAIVETEDTGDEASVLLGDLNCAGVATITSVLVFEFGEIDGEGFLHGSCGSGKGDGTAENLVAALEHLQIVIAGELHDFAKVRRVGTMFIGEISVGEDFVFLFELWQSLAMLQHNGDFNELMRIGRANGACSWKRCEFGALEGNLLGIRHMQLLVGDSDFVCRWKMLPTYLQPA
jgi:hypothetical protein